MPPRPKHYVQLDGQQIALSEACKLHGLIYVNVYMTANKHSLSFQDAFDRYLAAKNSVYKKLQEENPNKLPMAPYETYKGPAKACN